MENIEESALFNSKKLLFTSGSLEFGLEERAVMIEHHKRELIYICRQLKSFKKDVEHIILNRMPLSMVSNLAYNLVHNLVSCYVGLTIYEYLTTAYLLSENYNDNYRLWKIYTKFAKEIEDLIENLEKENVFNIGEESAVENLMPTINSEKHAVRSLLNLEHILSKINGEGLFHALIHYLRTINNSLERIKTGLNDLTDDDFNTIYIANYNHYKESYWPSEVIQFRHHIEVNYFRRNHDKIEILEKLLWDDKSQFKQDGTGRLWWEYFDDKKRLYFEMRRAGLNDEQWKYFFKNICRFEEYEKWIDELEHPQIEREDFPESEWDKIFKDAIDVKKVKIALQNLLPPKISITTWYIIYKIFVEIDWLHDSISIHFISWVKDVYGWQYKTEDFKNSVNPELKQQHSLDWNTRTMTSAKIAKDNIDFAESVRKEFVLDMEGKTVKKDNKYYFKKPELYIRHPRRQ